jgi:hypothetical protein
MVLLATLTIGLGCGKATYRENSEAALASGTIRTVSGARDITVEAFCPRGYAAELTMNGNKLDVTSVLAAGMTIGMLAKTINEVGAPGYVEHNAEVHEAVRRCIAFSFQDKLREMGD